MTPFKVILFLLVAVAVDVVFLKYSLSSWFFVWSGLLMVIFGYLMADEEDETASHKSVEDVPLSPSMYFDQAVRELGEEIHRKLREQDKPSGESVYFLKHITVSHKQLVIAETACAAMGVLLKSEAPYGLKAFEGSLSTNYEEFGYDNGNDLFGEPFGCLLHLCVRFGLPGETFSKRAFSTPEVPPENAIEEVVEEGETEEDVYPLTQPSDEPRRLTTHDIPQGNLMVRECSEAHSHLLTLETLQGELEEVLEETEGELINHLADLRQGDIKLTGRVYRPLRDGVSKLLEVELKDALGQTFRLCLTVERK